jgi:hypothetical protein
MASSCLLDINNATFWGRMTAAVHSGVDKDLVSCGTLRQMRQFAYKALKRHEWGGVALAPLPLLEFPPELQRHILGWIPLRELAQLACLNKEFRDVYVDRVNQRDAVVVSLLESHSTPDFRGALSCTQTLALPRDLVVDPPVRPLALCVLLTFPVFSADFRADW